jgi:two-component system cell cycle sensor histidine kinase/response regulator CckA
MRKREGAGAEAKGPLTPFDDRDVYAKFLTAALNRVADPIIVKDRRHRWVFVNDAFCAIAGQKRETLLGKSDHEFFPREEADIFWEKDEEVFKTGIENANEETITDSEGTTRTIVTKKTLYRSSLGEDFVVAVGRDVTLHKQYDDALRREKERVQRYLDIAGVILVVVGADQRVELINRKGCEILGYGEAEILGKNWFDCFIPEDVRKKVRHLFRSLMRGEIENIDYFENMVLTKSGEERTIAWHNTLLRNENGLITGSLSSGEDISERKRTEQELREKEELLRRAQKLEAVGRLAGGIAHDFNNLLTAIIGYTELLKMSGLPEATALMNVEEIRRAADRAANLTQQLLAFSRKQVLRPTVINLNTLIAGIEKLLTRVIGENIRLVARLDPDLGLLKADPGQIEQVIMNLIVNARDAMPAGGTVIVETRNVYLDRSYCEEHSSVTEGRYILLAISDTGHGMDDETKERIFEPFFTTKTKGKGTGLGLSTVYGIVKQSGGNVWVYSEIGRGTTFKIYLPRIEARREDAKPDKQSPRPTAGSELVLVVEDEDLVRNMLRDSLNSFGYEVLEAGKGSDAIELCMQRGLERVRLLITDVVMPQMSGKELAERLTAIYPEMKVLFISGYTNDAIVHHGVLDGGIQFLEKPFSPQVLGTKIREILDSR